MKIRQGFVSNSSSSSFIIHKSAFESDKDMHEFLKELNDIRYEFSLSLLGDANAIKRYGHVMWGESGQNFYTQGNFIFVEQYSAPSKLFEVLSKYNIDSKNKNVFDIN